MGFGEAIVACDIPGVLPIQINTCCAPFQHLELQHLVTVCPLHADTVSGSGATRTSAPCGCVPVTRGHRLWLWYNQNVSTVLLCARYMRAPSLALVQPLRQHRDYFCLHTRTLYLLVSNATIGNHGVVVLPLRLSSLSAPHLCRGQ